MKEQYSLLYEQMRQEINNCRQNDRWSESTIDCCFHTAAIYWIKLKNLIAGVQFPGIAEEIDFFKNIKPLFTSEIEYYSLVYMAKLFRPETPHAQEVFWMREFLRLEKFTNENAEFYLYYKNGETFMDEEYFVRENSDLSNFQHAPPYDLDEKVATSHDYLIAKLKALEQYSEFVDQEMQILRHKIEKK
jgi:hypothetical protein